MKKNMSNFDRTIRLVIAAALVGLFFGKVVGGTLGVIMLIVAGVFTLTSVISFCPLYTLIGFSTCSNPKK